MHTHLMPVFLERLHSLHHSPHTRRVRVQEPIISVITNLKSEWEREGVRKGGRGRGE